MTDHARLALIHAEIDGELDDRQRAELARCLQAEPDTRALRASLGRLCTTLDGIEQVEPPPGLRASILAALPQAAPARASMPGRLATPVRAWWSAPVWRYAAILAGVVVTATIVFELLDGQRPPASEVAGTLTEPRGATVIDSVQLTDGPVAGRVILTRDTAGLGVALDIKAGAPVDVLVASDGKTFRLNNLGKRDGVATPTRVALPESGMEGRSVDLTFLMAGQEVGRATLRTGGGH